jgi:hypothetical protein
MNNTVKTTCASREATRVYKTKSKRELGLDYQKTYPTPWEKQLIADIDRGYRFFYEQRPSLAMPRVSKDIINY